MAAYTENITKTIYEELDEHPDVQRFNALQNKLHQSTFWKAVHDAKPSEQWKAIRDLPQELWETACFDPENKLTAEERKVYPEVRAKAYIARDQIMGTPLVSGKSQEERLEAIQSILYIHPVWVKNHVRYLLKKHLRSLLDSYLKNEERQDVNLKEEEEKFMNSSKIKTFYRSIEEKKKRCDELMQYDNDFDLYRSMTSKEISDFI